MGGCGCGNSCGDVSLVTKIEGGFSLGPGQGRWGGVRVTVTVETSTPPAVMSPLSNVVGSTAVTSKTAPDFKLAGQTSNFGDLEILIECLSYPGVPYTDSDKTLLLTALEGVELLLADVGDTIDCDTTLTTGVRLIGVPLESDAGQEMYTHSFTMGFAFCHAPGTGKQNGVAVCDDLY